MHNPRRNHGDRDLQTTLEGQRVIGRGNRDGATIVTILDLLPPLGMNMVERYEGVMTTGLPDLLLRFAAPTEVEMNMDLLAAEILTMAAIGVEADRDLHMANGMIGTVTDPRTRGTVKHPRMQIFRYLDETPKMFLMYRSFLWTNWIVVSLLGLRASWEPAVFGLRSCS